MMWHFLAKGHLLSYKQNKLPVLLIGLAQQTAKLTQETSILPSAACLWRIDTVAAK